jgi:TPP-dependent pyruvate/acetoin dehydrogenase alpha subunit
MSTKSAKKKSANSAPALISDNKLHQLYAMMLRCRILDSHARNLCGGHSWKGKEAAIVGAAIDLRPEDAIVFPSNAAVAGFLKGMPLQSIFQSNKHSSEGAKKAWKVVASADAQGALATGIAYASRAGNKGSITLAFLSENPEGSETGRDALRFAGQHKVPVIYVYSGNQADATQAYAYGLPVIPVDGRDVVAVYRVAYECTIRARERGGPSVIACSIGSANGSSAKSQDPLRNMEKYLSGKGLFAEERKQSTIRTFEESIAKAISASKKAQHQQERALESRHIFFL